ncbi:hypothetical protein BN946_scf184829.g3 [Trametes cinnabarina]|uniref:Methyltransferase domain-containing protein n=1 Tax=Pycnoporus cinnabarinus TaxID=5643 RepID=A0A060S971_PYCCI|nr:hypothetical protein BN946_scf184829.g3 [Trametes cinnabarina]
MSDNNEGADAQKTAPVPLDASLYAIDDEALEFVKATTGIRDPEEVKKHVLTVQAEAYAVCAYPCIRSLKLARLPAYKQLLTLGKERKGAIFLDIGCCFGNDIRKAVFDGYPIGNVIGSDLHPEYWNLGHKLFKTTPETFPVPFVAGDAFDPAHLEPVPPFYSPPDTPRPELATLTSLNPLRGHVSAIHASAFFHLFDEGEQFKLAQALAGLLSPEPGSMLLGVHGGRHEKGYRTETGTRRRAHGGGLMFAHSPDSWTELWDGLIFTKGSVKVEAFLQETERNDLRNVPGVLPEAKFYVLVWSVTRL